MAYTINSGKVQFNATSAKGFRATLAIWHVFDFECKDMAKKYAKTISNYKGIIATNSELIDKLSKGEKIIGAHTVESLTADNVAMEKRIDENRKEFTAWKESQADSVKKSEKLFGKDLYKAYVASLSESDNAWRSSDYTAKLATLLADNGLTPAWDTLDELFHAVAYRPSTGSVAVETGNHVMALTENAWRKVLMGRLCDLMGDCLPTYKFQHILTKAAKKAAKAQTATKAA